MRFVVYGAGAVGGVIGALLFRHGHEVTLIARGPHHDAIRDRGLRLDTPDGGETLPVPVAARPAEVKFAAGDVVLLTMKSQDTAAALAELSAAAPPGIVVAPAQNGVENERLALRVFRDVYGVCVRLPAAHLEPGVVESYMAPIAGRLEIGRYPHGDDATAHAIAGALRDATFEAEVFPDVMRYKYGKLLLNLGNAVEGVIGPGAAGRDVTRLARDEGLACLRAAGIDVAEDLSVQSEMRPIRGRMRLGGSSYQSLQRGTGTIEADYLNGEIVLLGREHGVPTPVNELLQRLANRMARERLSPGLMTTPEFHAALRAQS